MECKKQANAVGAGAPDEKELELINALAQKKLEADEVFTFAVRLCDNEVDRDWERFSEHSLEQLAQLFVGKSGIFDHNWSAAGQSARIYRTELIREEKLTRAGKPYQYVKGWAYMMRTQANESLIAEIQGGIKKEVSVGCSVAKAVCSICGDEAGSCQHIKGRSYDGQLCWKELEDATDAYEWSFVAVPAQRDAGVIKGLEPSLKALVSDQPKARRELEALEKEAMVGRRWLKELRHEVARLAALRQPELDVERMEHIAQRLDADELTHLQKVLDRQVKEALPLGVQLAYSATEMDDPNDRDFLV